MENNLKELRRFAPAQNFPDRYSQLCEAGEKDFKAFWAEAARTLEWSRPFKNILEWNAPFAKWFSDGTLNASTNCLDRHVEKGHAEKIALIWESENGLQSRWSYGKLLSETEKVAAALSQRGIKKGDTVAIYMPLMPEAVAAMLACARIGATHTVIFAGFNSPAIRDRANDCKTKAIITSDLTYRKGSSLPLLETVRKAYAEIPTIEFCLCLKRDPKTELKPAKEIDWSALPEAKCAATHVESEHPLFVLYTSGTTGKPKGIVHSTGGYLTQVSFSTQQIFDLNEKDIYWCTADIGWVTGHSYLVYGPLSLGATAFIYEGALNFPDASQPWRLIDKYGVTILYTAPTAIRGLMREGENPLKDFSLKSLRLLGSVGEPINPEAWIWYHEQVGKKSCPIVDTWWQTETGAIMISPFPGSTTLKPGSASHAFPGTKAEILDEAGKPCPRNKGGYLTLTQPWPAMLRGILNDEGRYKEQYWSKFTGLYFTGDGAHQDEEGYFWIQGRVDDVLNVSGHRLGTMEIESAIVSHPGVAEAAVVGRPDDLKGQAVVAFVIPKASTDLSNTESLRQAIKKHVVEQIGAIARPDEIILTKTLPKTRSGKIMRRLLKDLAQHKQVTQDTTTLENTSLIEVIS